MAQVESKGWSSPAEDIFFGNVSTLTDTLAPGMYEPGYDTRQGTFLKRMKLSEQNIIRLSNSIYEMVVQDIRNFWAREEHFRRYRFPYKRGILLFGKPGGGKSSTINLVCQEVIAAGGYVLKFEDYNTFLPALKLLKRLHPNCRVVALMEDLDQIIYNGSVSLILNLLDGVEQSVDNVVWLATTNRPERLDQNIKNRPSRFDRRFEFKDPDIAARKAYISSLIKGKDLAKYDTDLWAKDSEGFSFAHIKELLISVVIFGNPYEDVIAELKGMGSAIHSDESE